MSVDIWITLAFAKLLSTLAPGQSVAYLWAVTARAGQRAGLAAGSGIILSQLFWLALALALTLGAREISPALFQARKLASGFVLIWLGLGIMLDNAVGGMIAERRDHGHVACVARGAWVGLANPLALIPFLSLFPGLVSDIPGATDPLVIAFFASAVLVASAAGLAANMFASRVLARVGQARRLQMASGSALVLLGVLLLLRQLI